MSVTYEMIERLMEAVEGECDGLAIDAGQALAILSHVMGSPSAISASPAGPFEMRHEEGGYVEFLNEDVPTVVREIDGRVAILTTLEQPRKVVGYRVYDPGSSPSEVFGSASPAGVGVETEPVLDKPARVGNGVFRKGVKHSTVILAAQRLYEHMHGAPTIQQHSTFPAALNGDEQ